MSKRAEDAALKAYPIISVDGRGERCEGSTAPTSNDFIRCIFQQGYEQAEKDMKERFIQFVHRHYPLSYVGWLQDFQKAMEEE